MFDIYVNAPYKDLVLKKFPSVPNKGDSIVYNYKYYTVEFIEYEFNDKKPSVDITIFLIEKGI